jgi:hypothetical protein
MHIGFDSVASDATVKTVADVTVPAGATHVEIQAVTQAVSYTMDDATDPTATAGMQFLTTDPPRAFLVDDLNRIRFTQGAGGAGVLNFHFGR